MAGRRLIADAQPQVGPLAVPHLRHGQLHVPPGVGHVVEGAQPLLQLGNGKGELEWTPSLPCPTAPLSRTESTLSGCSRFELSRLSSQVYGIQKRPESHILVLTGVRANDQRHASAQQQQHPQALNQPPVGEVHIWRGPHCLARIADCRVQVVCKCSQLRF